MHGFHFQVIFFPGIIHVQTIVYYVLFKTSFSLTYAYNHGVFFLKAQHFDVCKNCDQANIIGFLANFKIKAKF